MKRVSRCATFGTVPLVSPPGKGSIVTRMFTPRSAKPFEWLVVCEQDGVLAEHYVWSAAMPTERFARAVLRIPQRVPILIGRP